ncbi:MAG: SEC-C domain-containing protein [Candidatus Obscuribacterales bacterium]|nr:SEC-C domain-containing protein [Candidatus Obscuribacterales bacterium]
MRVSAIARNLAEVARLSDEDILKKLKLLGVKIEKAEFEELCRKQWRASKVTFDLWQKRAFRSQQVKDPGSWAYACVVELWRRWLKDVPCAELIELDVFKGYEIYEDGREEEAAVLWGEALEGVVKIGRQFGVKNLKDIEFGAGTLSIYDWIKEVFEELWALALDDPKWMERRRDMAAGLIECFADAEKASKQPASARDDGFWRMAMAESVRELAEEAEFEALFEKWLSEDPTWADGWVFYADSFDETPEKCEALLKRALEHEDLDDKGAVYLCLANHYRMQGNESLAQEYDLRGKEAFSSGGFARRLGLNEENSPEDLKNSFDNILGKLLKMGPALLQEEARPKAEANTSTVQARPMPSADTEVGRKQPCPCGSGKKFKRCCGS